MNARRQRIYKVGFRVIAVALVLCGASGAAAVYVGAKSFVGPSYEDLHGVECRSVASTKTKDADGIWIRHYIVAEAKDDLARLRTALRVAEFIRKEQSPHLVQVSVVDSATPKALSSMRGRAIGAQVTLIPEPVNEIEKQAGTHSGYSVQGLASPDGEFHGIRFDAMKEDLEVMIGSFREVKGCAPSSDGSGV